MNEQDKHRARARENPDPHEKNTPVPRIVVALVVTVLTFAVGYIVTTQRDDDPTLGDRRTMATLTGKAKDAASPANGGELYAANCVACHQANGAGLPGAFPPLAGSEWVAGKEKLVVNIVLHGITGKLSVKGNQYNGAMPSFKSKFDDREIAAVLTFVRSNFGNTSGPVSAALVQAEREAGKDRSAPWNGDEDLAKLK